MPIICLFSTTEDAQRAIADLNRAGFRAGFYTTVSTESGEVTAESLTRQGVPAARAARDTERVHAGSTLMVVHPPVTTTGIVTGILARNNAQDLEITAAPVSGSRQAPPAGPAPKDGAAPLSAALGWTVLLNDPEPLSRWLGWSTLSRSQFPLGLAPRKPVRDPAPLSTAIGMKTLSANPAPLSSWLGYRTLSRVVAPLSQWLGWRLLSGDPTPLSTAIGRRTLSSNPTPLSSALGWRTLSRNPTPLSTALGWKVLKR